MSDRARPRSGRRKPWLNTAVFGILMQLVFLYAIASTEMDQLSFYMWLLVFLFIQIVIHKDAHPEEHVLDLSDFQVKTLGPQMATGLALGVLVMLPFVLAVPFVLPTDFPSQLGFQALFVSLVETIYMVVFIKTIEIDIEGERLKIGRYLWVFFFPLIHPQVRNYWFNLQFPAHSFVSFSVIATFALFFQLLYTTREIDTEYSALFGMGATWIFHLTVNVIIITHPANLGGLDLFPFQAAGGVLVASLAFTVLSVSCAVRIAARLLRLKKQEKHPHGTS